MLPGDLVALVEEKFELGRSVEGACSGGDDVRSCEESAISELKFYF